MKHIAETYNWRVAISKLPLKKSNYRKVTNGYQLTLPDVSSYLGEWVVSSFGDLKVLFYEYHVRKFLSVIHKAGLDENECKIVYERYAVFPQHRCFNVKGNEVNWVKYPNSSITAPYRLSKIYADVFNETRVNTPRNYGVKLTADEVKEMRKLNESEPWRYTSAELARMYNVSRQCTADILHKRTWKGV